MLNMKYIFCFIIIVSFNLYADVASQNTDKVCLKHAISVIDQLNSEISPKLEKDQLNNILRITTENCKKYFTNNDIEKSVVSANDDENSEDWFTEKILKGDTSRKEGNKRLDRMRHK